MTKTEAIAAMERGEKVTHTYFLGYEYIYLQDGELLDEDETPLQLPQFWERKTHPTWQTGWSIYQPETGALAD